MRQIKINSSYSWENVNNSETLLAILSTVIKLYHKLPMVNLRMRET